MKKNVLIGLLTVMLAFSFIGCDNDNGSTTYSVTFNSNGGSNVQTITGIISGTTITLPIAPTKDDNEFVGWYIDNETFSNEFTSATVINANLTVFAKWASNNDYGFIGGLSNIQVYNWDETEYTGDIAQVRGQWLGMVSSEILGEVIIGSVSSGKLTLNIPIPDSNIMEMFINEELGVSINIISIRTNMLDIHLTQKSDSSTGNRVSSFVYADKDVDIMGIKKGWTVVDMPNISNNLEDFYNLGFKWYVNDNN